MTSENTTGENVISSEHTSNVILPPLREEDYKLEPMIYGFCVDKKFMIRFGEAQAREQFPEVQDPLDADSAEQHGEGCIEVAVSDHTQWSKAKTHVPTKYIYTWPENAAGPLIPDTASDTDYTPAWLIGCADNRNARRAQPAQDVANVMNLKHFLRINDEPQWFWCISEHFPIQPWTPTEGKVYRVSAYDGRSMAEYLKAKASGGINIVPSLNATYSQDGSEDEGDKEIDPSLDYTYKFCTRDKDTLLSHLEKQNREA